MSQQNDANSWLLTKWVMLTVACVVLLLAIWQIRGILLLALTSVLLVVLFTTPIRFLTRYGIRRGPATAVSLLSIPIFLVVVVMTVLPLLTTQFVTLADLVQEGIQAMIVTWENLDVQHQKLFLGWGDVIIEVPPDPVIEVLRLVKDSFQLDAQLIQQISTQLVNAFSQLGVTVIPVVSGVASTALNILIVIFMSLYLLTDPKGHEDGLIRLLPLDYRQRGREIVDRMDDAMRGWLESTLLAMFFVGIATWLGLSVLGLREALALGVIAGLLAFIPTFGTLIACVLAVAVGILQQPQNVAWIIVITYAISLIQSQIISPLLVAGRINLPPILVLLGQIVAGVLFGFMGLLLAVPLTVILVVLVQEVYIRDILGDRSVNIPQADVEVQPVRVEDGLVADSATG